MSTIVPPPAGLGPWRGAHPPSGFQPFPDEAVGASLDDRFRSVAAARGDHPAIVGVSHTWTYADAVAEVDRLSGGIAALVGHGEPTPVAILATHDGELVLAILSVIASGHVVVVLDPTVPDDVNDHVLRESGAGLVLHDSHLVEQAERLASHVDGHAVLLGAVEPSDHSGPPTGPDAPAMLAFTSGTSGDSKAATITHRVLLNLVRGATNALGISPDDRMPMLFPVSLAVAAYPMFLPLLNGGTLVTLDVRSVGLDPIGPFLEDQRITLAYMAPTVIRFLVDALGGRSFPDLRMIALGGEVVDAEVVDLTESLLAPAMLANGYGTTETGVVTLQVFEAGTDVGRGVCPVGHAVPESDITIVDDAGRPVDAGVPGEIVVTSPHMFDGYWGHPELSASVLSPDPDGRPGWTRYRTGDAGFLGPDGALTVIGRVDERVKVRGRPVVVSDVEASIVALDSVRDAAVVAVTADGVTDLVAHVVPEPGGDIAVGGLRRALLDTTEAYRVPRTFIECEALPRLPNGKLDRQRLVAVADDVVPATTPRLADTSAASQQLSRIFTELTGAVDIGPDDDFVDLGGDSLHAAVLVIRIEEMFGVTIPMGELVHHRTVSSLSELIDAYRASTGPASTVALVKPGVGERLWFVPDLQGSAYRVRHLAAALGGDWAVWSFESPLLAGLPNDTPTLATFAARLVTDLLEAQPEGPYWLAGYSFGGICAYEMARQLTADGHEVAFVGVVDVGPGYRGEGWHGRRSPLRPWFGIRRPEALRSRPGDVVREFVSLTRESPKSALRQLSVRTGAARVVDPARFKRDLADHGVVRPEWRLWYVWEEHWRIAAKAWDRDATYPGHVDLFWAADSASADATMGWGPLVGSLSIHRFDGHHTGILEPDGAPALAAELEPVLAEARAR